MHFYEFVKSLPKQVDSNINEAIELIKNDLKFPKDTSDPSVLGIYLYLQVDHKQTNAFQKLLMLYQQMVKDNKLPERSVARQDMFMEAINLIVVLQNNDSRYKYA